MTIEEEGITIESHNNYGTADPVDPITISTSPEVEKPESVHLMFSEKQPDQQPSDPEIKTTDDKKCLPKRLILVVMGFFSMVMLYALRVNLSVAIVSMVRSNSTTTSHTTSSETFDWDEKTQGLVLGSFFWGYVIFQLPGGRMADLFGSKWLLCGGILGTSLLTIASPIAAGIHYTLFIVCRVLEGMFEGVVIPSMHAMIAKWFPTSERSTAAGVIYSGQMIGVMLTMPFAALLCDWSAGGWESVFYLFGLAGVIWSGFWVFLIYETPESHPTISKSELKLIMSNQSNTSSSKKKPDIPWRSIFTSLPLWALVIAHFGQNWGYYTMLTQLPRYFQNVLHFDLKENGLYSALPYLSQALVASTIGFLCDGLYRTGRFSLGTLRKSFNSAAFVGTGICFLLITLIGRDKLWSIVILIVALGIDGMIMAGFMVTHVDMSPNYAGTLMGITNCLANFSGVFAPMVVGWILDAMIGDSKGQEKEERALLGWNYVFYLSAAVFGASALIFVVFGSNEVQKWNDVGKKEGEEEKEEENKDKQNGQL